MIDIYNVSLLDILPESLKGDAQMRALAEAITPEIQAVSAEMMKCLLLPNLDNLPEEIVDVLAWQYHVDFYEPDLPVEQKRELVRESFRWHQHKGTPWAVEQVVSIIFAGAKVAEWFEYGGLPYHFRVETEQPFRADTDLDRLVRLINATKNCRSWLEDVTVKRTIAGSLFFGGIHSEYKKYEIYPALVEVMPDISEQRIYGGIVSLDSKTTIYPEVN